jgi:hypothetical protein
LRVHYWFPCNCMEPCDCSGHNCAGTHCTKWHAAAAATTAQSLGILLIMVLPPTTTPSEINTDNWHCFMWRMSCNAQTSTTRPCGPGASWQPSTNECNPESNHRQNRIHRDVGMT